MSAEIGHLDAAITSRNGRRSASDTRRLRRISRLVIESANSSSRRRRISASACSRSTCMASTKRPWAARSSAASKTTSGGRGPVASAAVSSSPRLRCGRRAGSGSCRGMRRRAQARRRSPRPIRFRAAASACSPAAAPLDGAVRSADRACGSPGRRGFARPVAPALRLGAARARRSRAMRGCNEPHCRRCGCPPIASGRRPEEHFALSRPSSRQVEAGESAH